MRLSANWDDPTMNTPGTRRSLEAARQIESGTLELLSILLDSEEGSSVGSRIAEHRRMTRRHIEKLDGLVRDYGRPAQRGNAAGVVPDNVSADALRANAALLDASATLLRLLKEIAAANGDGVLEDACGEMLEQKDAVRGRMRPQPGRATGDQAAAMPYQAVSNKVAIRGRADGTEVVVSLPLGRSGSRELLSRAYACVAEAMLDDAQRPPHPEAGAMAPTPTSQPQVAATQQRGSGAWWNF